MPELLVSHQVLATLPPDIDWLWRAESQYCARRGNGADAELLWRDGSRWHACALPHVGCPQVDSRGRGLVFAEEVLWELRLAEPQALHARAFVPGGRSACYLDERIIILTEDGVLFILGDSSAWRIPRGIDPSSHAWNAIAPAGNVLLVTEVPNGRQASDILHVLKLEPSRQLACWVAIPDDSEDERNRFVILDTALGPFEGHGVDPRRSQCAALPQGVVGLDHVYFTITGIADENTGPALTRVDAPQLDARLPPSPTVVPLETTRVEPAAPDLAGIGPLSGRLFKLMRDGGVRREPDVDVIALLTLPMPADLYAYLHTWAHYNVHVRFESVDWWTDLRPDRSAHPLLVGSALFGVTLGTTGGGQRYVAQVHDAGKAVFRGIEDSGHAFVTGHNLESFLRALVHQTRTPFPTPATVFDDLLP